ncbi:hypothetical protein, partial [Brasilonema octagenarum]|uniref:hypothetical protein n=1 Tax=Brasilonema octagenarum TaxID=417105 RepID=UPI001B7D29E0
RSVSVGDTRKRVPLGLTKQRLCRRYAQACPFGTYKVASGGGDHLPLTLCHQPLSELWQH